MPWHARYIESSEWEQIFREIAERKLGAVIGDWENCMAEAKLRMWEKFSSAQQPSGKNQDAFVKAVYSNILEDIRRELCGRPRPPVKMKAEGSPITNIFELYCLEKCSATEISYRLDLPRSTVSYWTGWLAKHNKCPKRLQVVSSSSDDSKGREDYAMEYAESDSINPIEDNWLEDEQLSPIKTLLWQAASTGDQESDYESSVEPHPDMQKWSEKLTLTDRESLILRLRYIEGYSIRKAADALNISSTTLRNVETALLERLRAAIE